MPEQVVGGVGATNFGYKDGKPVLTEVPQVLLNDEEAGKPEGIPDGRVFGEAPGSGVKLIHGLNSGKLINCGPNIRTLDVPLIVTPLAIRLSCAENIGGGK